MAKHLFKFVVCVGIVCVAIACYLRFGVLNKPKETIMETSSLLIDAINISELSTAEFKYRGIAEIYTNAKKTKVRCRVCYEAVVKAGIDMNKVRFEVDDDNKMVTAILPPIELKVTIVDQQSMAVLPSNATVEVNEMLKYSKEDAEKEARESNELMDKASENLKANIEGILYPVLKARGYSLKFRIE